MADDLGYGDIGAYGQSLFTTPNFGSIGPRRHALLQHYSGSTVCAPSRSALMTGQHTGHTFIRGNSERGFTLENEGQYHWPLKHHRRGTQRSGLPHRSVWQMGTGVSRFGKNPNFQGFDQFYGYNCQRVAHNYYPTHLWDNQNKRKLTGNKVL